LTAEYLAAETERRRWSKLLRHAKQEVEHGRRRLQKWTGWLEAARSPRTRHEAGEEGAGWLAQQGWLGQRRWAKELGAYEQVRASCEDEEDEAMLEESVLLGEVDALEEEVQDLTEVVAAYRATQAARRRPRGRPEQRGDQEKQQQVGIAGAEVRTFAAPVAEQQEKREAWAKTKAAIPAAKAARKAEARAQPGAGVGMASAPKEAKDGDGLQVAAAAEVQRLAVFQ
jgi:hypothetical protein